MPVNAKEVRDYRKGIFTLGGITGVLALPVWAHVASTAHMQLGQNAFYVSEELIWWFVLALALTLTLVSALPAHPGLSTAPEAIPTRGVA